MLHAAQGQPEHKVHLYQGSRLSLASIQNTSIHVQNFWFTVLSLAVIITLPPSPHSPPSPSPLLSSWTCTDGTHHHLINFQRRLSVTCFLSLLDRWTVFLSLYVFMTTLLFVSSVYLRCMFHFLSNYLPFPHFFQHYFLWGSCKNPRVHISSSFITVLPTFLFSVNRATSKKLCTGPGLRLPSNVKSSLYVTFREGGREEGAFVIIPRESSRIPTTGYFCGTESSTSAIWRSGQRKSSVKTSSLGDKSLYF